MNEGPPGLEDAMETNDDDLKNSVASQATGNFGKARCGNVWH